MVFVVLMFLLLSVQRSGFCIWRPIDSVLSLRASENGERIRGALLAEDAGLLSFLFDIGFHLPNLNSLLKAIMGLPLKFWTVFSGLVLRSHNFWLL